jgi:CheY-like chemotaxis protein
MTAEQSARGPGLAEAPAAAPAEGWPAAQSSAVIPFEDHRRRVAGARAWPAATIAAAAVAEPLRVLVIDDEQDEFLLVRDLLARAEGVGFAADWAPTAAAGLARLLAGGYDACLCDYRLQQGGDGVQLAREAQRRGCRTPVILTTGFATPELELEAIEAGAVDLIDKEEFDTQRLDRAVRFAAGRQRRLDRSAGPAPPAGDDLAGPALLADRLERALAAARRHRTGVAVVVVDPCGPAGPGGGADRDLLLRAAARRLRDRVRETDTVGRTESGELAVVLAGLGRPEDAVLVPAKLLDALAVPVLPDGDAGADAVPPRHDDGQPRRGVVPARRGRRGRAAAPRRDRHAPGEARRRRRLPLPQ